MLPSVTNLFDPRFSGGGKEQFFSLLQRPTLKLEHIVSHGQPTEPGRWYDQMGPEWVVLIRGQAKLRFECDAMLELRAGDCLLIPARLRHRVDFCSDDAIWLALHLEE